MYFTNIKACKHVWVESLKYQCELVRNIMSPLSILCILKCVLQVTHILQIVHNGLI